jgi:hypothetical protein
MYGGANLSDESLRSDIGGVLGEDPVGIGIESRRTEGPNTYVVAKTNKGTRFACNFLGGGTLTFGMRTAPSCNQLERSGDIKPIGSNSTSCNAMLKAAGQCK